ncbi:GrpB family protein [Polyangium sorediatum]|uniref:GrpB family protein n=1 Tax=Polyangium sorediatum TaxID=889274 RepID=A0ABT6NZU1_9BACT|nr:GrpB family protein [Polyangium sorediatum]MDI1433860.1 GrpB family protein [Polyangium sorediatum]
MRGDVDEPISIVAYDARWPLDFEAEAARVRAALGPVVVAIEPFGSSAVPGLVSKPIVDILVGVADLQEAKPHVAGLVAIGYEDFGEIFVPGRIYLRKRGAAPHFNVAVTEHGGPFWAGNLAVREYLRAHPAEVEAYARHKREAVERGATMFSSYSQAKDEFVRGLRERALAWAAGRGAA